MEKQSGLELDWYFDQWINTTRTLDYGILEVLQVDDSLLVTLVRKGEMVMPADLRITWRNGERTDHHVPLSLTRGAKTEDSERAGFVVHEPWQWTNSTYTIVVKGDIGSLEAVVIDPLERTADMDRSNNSVLFAEGMRGVVRP
jgi:hypothetical protein